MELVQGFSGSKFGKLYGKDMKKCFKLCEELLRHINHLHNKQIGHFDIKPDNLVVSVDDQLKVTLVDYGFAHQLYKDQDLSERFGTPYYCSPQIARAADVNKKSDIWSAMVTVMAIILSDQETGPIPPLKKCYPNYRLSTLQTHLKCEITGPEELIACLPGSVDKHFQDLLSRGLGVKLRHRAGPRKLLKHRAFSKFREIFMALQSFLQEQRLDDGFLSDYAKDNFKEMIGDPLNENCMFNALANQLVEHLSLQTTGQKFREEIVKHLRHNPKKTDGMSLVHFLDNDDPSWRQYKEQKAHIFQKTATEDWHTKQNQLCQIKWRWYLRHMSHSGTQGDALILWAAAQLYEVDIRIIADNGNHFVIRTEAEFPQAELLLGYYQKLRFVSLRDIAVTEVLNADQVPTGEVLLELLTPAIPIFLENAEEMIEVQTETNVDQAEVTEDPTKK
ncbi:calcium-dependent protein kinase 2-like isoform X2 [Lingula anatina]|uniref:Calcium-dependent protein kinase 2-like isoform X2 n=1 Tax=Lingula anatina TaxID=7574 RepID=A0A1S3K0H9_LINAN|nr:calcium-dependent protein kinase 2-like isoform X2 [Lingula anatina]|eukprot:XP_013416150.1 calcium-dependent protein kinase 2-like isoform X2 [Lingula anatina]